jgi:hypothetical protein
MFSTYMTDYVPAVMKEVLGLYDVDGVYTNAWPPLGSIPRCACGVCRTLPPHGTLEHWEAFNRRTIELWRLYDGLAKAKKPSLFYFGNLGGGVRSTADLVSLGELADWFPVRQPGPRRRRHPDLGLRDAGPRLPRRAAGQDGDQRHRRVVDRRAALAQRPQGDPRSAHVDERDGGLGDGAVSPHHRRRNRPRRGPARPRAGASILRLARAAPAPLHQPPLHRVHRRRHGPARPVVPYTAGGLDDAAVPERPLSGADSKAASCSTSCTSCS